MQATGRLSQRSQGDQPNIAARSWEDYQRDLVCDDRSCSPRISAEQLRILFPDGAPRSWALMVQPRRRRPRLVRASAWVVSLALGAVTALSETAAGIVAGLFARAGEVFTIVLHLVGILGSDGHFGLVGRVIGAAALVGALVRVGWRLARWGAAPLGEDL